MSRAGALALLLLGEATALVTGRGDVRVLPGLRPPRLARSAAEPVAAPRQRVVRAVSRSSVVLCARPPVPPTQLWRLTGVSVPFDELTFGTNEKTGAPEPWWKDDLATGVSDALRAAVANSLDIGVELLGPGSITVVRRSLDARPRVARRRSDLAAFDDRPRYAYIVDVALPASVKVRKSDQLVRRPAPLTPAPLAAPSGGAAAPEPGVHVGGPSSERAEGAGVIIVGAGPAGLFAALTLIDAGVRDITIVERGQPVETRGKDIGRLIQRRELLADSNFCYGEGGAGTWSDGKLTTRIGRNSAAVRLVLERLVEHGAPARILVDGKPHLGTDRLVKILQHMRAVLVASGVCFRWGARVQALLVEGGRAAGVRLAGEEGEVVRGRSVVLAVGHSARELLAELRGAGVPLASKPFAVGFRIEHPQALINGARLGEYAHAVAGGALPAADYRLTWQPRREGGGATGRAAEGEEGTEGAEGEDWAGGTRTAVGGAAYSFCMCPGGQIVPTSTSESQLCVNGMSFSRRQSKWANSAVVTEVHAEALQPYAQQHGPLAGLAFQEHIEQLAAQMGGGGLVAPVQLASDFIAGRLSDPSLLPPSSYRLGVRSARLDLIYPPALTASLRAALTEWERRIPGFASDPAALLHGVETRTSCPVQIARHADSLQCPGLEGVYPAGEGAGWAGGIVSAAVDGVRVGRALALASGVPLAELRGLAAATEDEAGDEGGARERRRGGAAKAQAETAGSSRAGARAHAAERRLPRGEAGGSRRPGGAQSAANGAGGRKRPQHASAPKRPARV